MIDRRRKPRPTPPAVNSPSSSGPRWTMVSRIRTSRSGFTGPGGRILTTPQIPHTRPSPPLLVWQSKPRPVLGHHEQSVDFDPVSPGEVPRGPSRSLLVQRRVSGQRPENGQELRVRGVVMGRAQVHATPVPAPFSAIVPEGQATPESLDSIVEQATNAGIPGLDVQVVEPEKAEQKAVQDAWQRIPRILLIEDAPVFECPHPSVLDALLEHARAPPGERQQALVARDAIPTDERADDHRLVHRGNPGSPEVTSALVPVEVTRPDRPSIIALAGPLPQPLDLEQEPNHTPLIGIPDSAVEVHETPPRNEQWIVLKPEQPIALPWNALAVHLEVVQEEAVTVDIVMTGSPAARLRGYLERVVGAKAYDLRPERADYPPHPCPSQPRVGVQARPQ